MDSVNDHFLGFGSPEAALSDAELSLIVETALSAIGPGERVLAIVPDKTRDDNTHLIVPVAFNYLKEQKVKRLDTLVAQGTHVAMSTTEKLKKLGFYNGNKISELGNVFDHRWSDKNELVQLGELSGSRSSEITDGLWVEPIPITINRLLAPGRYDHVLIFGSTSPHEVAGFSGGAKYFFPGISGKELTNVTHWIGALSGIENTIGRIETPVRRLIESAAEFIDANIICFSSVVTRTDENRLRTHALFGGDIRTSFRNAAAVSSEVQIKYTSRKYKKVVAILDSHYDELWTGGKASYKLGGIIEDGGELIIYAPHLVCFSNTHGSLIERYGYAEINQIKNLVAESEELRENLCVAAHLAHVAYSGRIDPSGSIVSKYGITLSTQIDEAACRKANLGYLDPNRFRKEDFRNDPDTRIVLNAGRDLYMTMPK